ncbi:MAG: benzoate/H(+) symporter BenE family transporter [Lysobacterales bacterium]
MSPLPQRRLWTDLSLSALTAGFIAVLVGFTSSVAIVFQAATALGATSAQLASWMWALGVGMGLCSLLPSWWLRKPVMVAWSTPGAAVLATGAAAGGYTLAEATGAFLLSGLLCLLAGATGLFSRLMARIPLALAAALLAGVLARFGLDAFSAAAADPLLVILMLLAYLLGRRFAPRYAVPLVLAVGLAICLLRGQMHLAGVNLSMVLPEFVMPEWHWPALLSLGLPLFIVTMASQNLPGVAAIRAAGYELPISRLITLTGAATLILAPFGAFALNLSAITASIAMGREAHEDPARRYVAAMSCGAIYVLIGLYGGAVAGVLLAFPKAFVSAIAGLALLGTIGGSLALALAQEADREAALITFLVTLSGLSLAGIGSAFWGVVAGITSLLVGRWRRRMSGV